MRLGQISIADFLLGWALAQFLVIPLSYLAHELGHAAVALRVGKGQVTILVGRRKPAIGFTVMFDRLTFYFSPVPNDRGQFGGIIGWDRSSAGYGGQLAVALAGPLVTALLVPLFTWAVFACAGMPRWIQMMWLISALAAFFSNCMNLYPWRIKKDARLAPNERDGPRALAAYRAWRGRTASEASSIS
jgi:hypothetical protein